MKRVNKKLRTVTEPRRISQIIEEAEGNSAASESASSFETTTAVEVASVKTVTRTQTKATKGLPIAFNERMDTLKFIVRLVEKAQPWLVLMIFISHFVLKRN
jgi:hypothetical protein